MLEESQDDSHSEKRKEQVEGDELQLHQTSGICKTLDHQSARVVVPEIGVHHSVGASRL